jgi:class 3 adenylate cyclase/tetratricopeptide (TPR) repeat protein
VIACSKCARENPDDARFCNSCGHPLVEPSAVREERKVVTAVFVDLVGSTARAERLDPEDVRALLRSYHETLRQELERHGGTVEKFIGDAVVAVYGAPRAHEDDPERAVRAALAARDSIAALNDRDDTLDLHVRIGVATGEALVALDASPLAGESMVAGDVMNTAARIQSAAPVDGILVGAATYRATGRVVVYRQHPAVDAKGKGEPVVVWEAVEALGRVGDLGAEPSTPLVGREHERALLLGAFARVRVEREPQLVTLVGVPGIGKSRLVAELGEIVLNDEEIISWRYGRCLPYGDGVTFWALGEIVKAQCGIHENDPAAVAAEKLASAVADLVPEHDRRWVEATLGPLLGLVPDDVAVHDRRNELHLGWRTFLESVAERRPLVMVIDDLQWADDGLLDFVDSLIELVEGVSLLVVACARPELLERRPGWGGGKRNALTVSLGPLSPDDTGRLVESLLGRDPADAGLRATVVERAAGNPLYAEEFARMQTAGGTAGLPDSVLGIVTARVDLLPAAEKELLRDAAVMGSVVWSDGLRAVSDCESAEDVGELLRALGRKEFLRRERHSAVTGATQHAFVHGLVRDAVYAQLSRPDRIERHVRVARWIESLPDDRREDRAELLAHHYVQAIELADSAGLDADALRPAATAALRESGMRAFSIGAYPSAVRALRAAARWTPGGLDSRALRVLGKSRVFTEQSGSEELRLAYEGLVAAGTRGEAAVAAIDIAYSHWQHGDGAGTAEWVARGLELVEGEPPSFEHAHVVAQAARFAMLAGRSEESLAIADRALDSAEASSAHAPRTSALITKATACANSGDYSTYEEDFEEALALAHERNPSEAGRAYFNLGSIRFDLGDLDGAQSACRLGLAHYARMGMVTGPGRGNLCETCFLLGAWDEAEEVARKELERGERTGGLYADPTFLFVLAEIDAARTGVQEETVASARRIVELALMRGDDQAVLPALAGASWMLARSREEDAGRLLDDLVERRRASPGGIPPGPWTVHAALALDRLGRSGELAAIGEPPGSRFLRAALALEAGRYGEAAETLRAIGSVQLEAEAEVLAARACRAADDERGAEAMLTRARELLAGLGATARLRELDASAV